MSVADHGWLTGCQSVGLRAASALPEVTGAHVIVHVNMNRSRYLPLGGYGGRPEVAATGRPPGGSLLSVAALGVGPHVLLLLPTSHNCPFQVSRVSGVLGRRVCAWRCVAVCDKER